MILDQKLDASRSFSRRVTSAVGTAIASWVLVRIEFPTGTATSDVSQETIRDLGLYFGPIVLLFGTLAIAALFAYRITRADHQRNLETLGLSQATD